MTRSPISPAYRELLTICVALLVADVCLFLAVSVWQRTGWPVRGLVFVAGGIGAAAAIAVHFTGRSNCTPKDTP